MSAAERFDAHDEQHEGSGPVLGLAADVVEVRRNGGLAAVVGLASSVVAIAWFSRAIASGAVLDWVLVAVTGVIAVVWLAAFADARAPLLVADVQGVRARLGRTWIGLPWSAVAQVEHRGRKGLLRDGRLDVVPHNPERLLAELTPSAARRARFATRAYGGPLALPLGPGVRVRGTDDLRTALEALVGGAAPVHEPDSQTEVEASGTDAGAMSGTPVPWRRAYVVRRVFARVIHGVAERLPRRVREDDDLTEEPLDGGVVEASPTPRPVREVVPPTRADVLHVVEFDEVEDTVVLEQPTDEVEAHTARVRPIAREAHPVEPLVIDDLTLEPASEPVIGPEIRAARTRIGLSADQLAERTRIRPHVIEAIEVDDFVPCGGDFYARGHLRTLARVLGLDVQPLLTAYDERYANAPIDARRVFEAELASSGSGPIRSVRGGPNWSVLVAAVMAVVLCWSVAQLILDAPGEVRSTPVLDGSGGPGGAPVTADPVKVVVEAPSSGAEVVVRDQAGKIVFDGRLAIGENHELELVAPARVQSSDGSVTVTVAGKQRGPVGEAGSPAQGTYAASR